MGFMDKARRLAEQAQEKLDEAHKSFNRGQDGQGQQASGGAQYDQHGRPIEEPPAGAAPPPSAEPVEAGPADAAPEETPQESPQEKPHSGDSNASPDPFKPIQ